MARGTEMEKNMNCEPDDDDDLVEAVLNACLEVDEYNDEWKWSGDWRGAVKSLDLDEVIAGVKS